MDKFTKKACELVSQMTLEEKCSQLKYDSPAIERLGIPAYNWWNEGLHGVARAGTATVFPQAIGLAATFDTELLREIADVISTEARAKYNAATEHGDRDIYKGLTLWSPNINIFRDPRWGRGHETYGEDPYLTSELAVSFVKGLQGDGEYLKAAACAKHFAVHSGPESLRHEFDARVSPKDLEETYLYAFEKLVKAGVEGVMGAYNRVNGEPACASEFLMKKLEEWGFDGYFVSDCWAISDFHTHHGVTKTAVESAALALEKGCVINCGNTYLHLMNACEQGLIDESQIDEAVVKALRTRLRLGMGQKIEYDDIPYSVVSCSKHRELTLKAACESVVLLKNDGILPLDKSKINSVAVIGPNADSREALRGNYAGTSAHYVTFLQGIEEEFDGIVYYSEGCHLYKDRTEGLALPYDRISEALTCAENADVSVLFLGLDASLEGEEDDTGNAYASGDKSDLRLPAPQRFLLKNVLDLGKPTVVVLASGSSLNIEDERENALIQAWYPGESGGKALAKILFGEVSPSGKLPVTFYKNSDDLPDFCDYSMSDRTYKNVTENVLYPFGFGLTYTTVEIKKLEYSDYSVNVTATNIGKRDTAEILQVYRKSDSIHSPQNAVLCGFKRIFLKSGKQTEFSIKLSEDTFTDVDDNGDRKIFGEKFTLYCGVSQPGELSEKLCGVKCLSVEVTKNNL